MNPLKKRILEISYRHGLSHIGSCITAVDIIDEIYKIKKKDEPFILSSGHAGLALYCVIEKKGGRNAEDIWLHHGTHPDRCAACSLDCSTGSLGQGLAIAVGMALSNRKKKVWALISDGEAAEGSIWEALRIAAENKLTNLKLFCNCNGFSALEEIKGLAYRYHTEISDNKWKVLIDLKDRFSAFGWNVMETKKEEIAFLLKHFENYDYQPVLFLVDTNFKGLPFLHGVDAHYYKLTEKDAANFL